MGNSKLRMARLFIVGLMLIFILPSSQVFGFTDPRDIYAIDILYINLGFPPLSGWRIGGDPCVEMWQGVQCVDSYITAVILTDANLEGQLTDAIGNFTSIITINLSGNHIGGTIPENLPLTLRRLFLSSNQFIGSIPSSLANLTLLSDLSLANNLLEGKFPDCFQSLTGLINLDLSNNSFSGQLPQSMGNLSSLTSLDVENNHLSGTLNVLQDLPLLDLDIENNLFSGPIPPKLLAIPSFRKEGNPFNITLPPLPAPPVSPPPSLWVPPFPPPLGSANISFLPKHKGGANTNNLILYIAIPVAVLITVIIIIIIIVRRWKFRPEKLKHVEDEENPRMLRRESYERTMELGKNVNVMTPNADSGNGGDKFGKQEEHKIDSKRTDVVLMPSLNEKVIVETIAHPGKRKPAALQKLNPRTSVSTFSVADLQQYTNSFSKENLIRKEKLGKVYFAELPDGKLLTVLKLDLVNANVPTHEFCQLGLSISELRHPSILELVGYCAEFDQRLLVYNYFSEKTLHDILHSGDDLKNKLSFNVRVEIALAAARVLEYLHEGCRPPVIHQNFDSANILLDDELAVRVSGCGLSSLILSSSVNDPLSSPVRAWPNYGPPEINDYGTYTDKSDVYCLGVVMLELLTGRRPYDSSRTRDQRYLVRWVRPHLHDINTLSEMVDPCIEGKLSMKSLSRFADIIGLCTQIQPEFRPPISEIVQKLASVIEDPDIY